MFIISVAFPVAENLFQQQNDSTCENDKSIPEEQASDPEINMEVPTS
jgi:hypothetical protein